jgi:hypothetical protein
MSAYRHATHDESVESLLEFLRISSRVAVVELEPKRARAFAEVLERAMEFKEAAIRKAVTEEREACAKLVENHVNEWWGMNRRSDGLRLADLIRARGLSGTPQLDDVKRCGA